MLQTITKCYEGKTVLITGHTGFKGSWLTLWLQKLGAKVVGYSLEPPSFPSMFNLLNLNESIISIHGDIRDFNTLLNTMQEHKPDIMFHMAAQALVRPSYDDPIATYSTNVLGTATVMEAVRKYKRLKAFINVTSDKCYENNEWVWGYREEDRMGGSDPYSSSKGCAELVFSSFLRSYFPIATYKKEHTTLCGSVRAGNVIGGGDWGKDRLIPDCVTSLHNNKPISLRFPNAIRPWQHVLEPLSGYLYLGAQLLNEKQEFVDGWNFGPSEDSAWEVERVVQHIIKVWGKGDYTISSTQNPHEANWLKLDCSKARQILGWHPTWLANEAIEHTINWYKMYYNDAPSNDLLELSLNTIRIFEAKNTKK